ncbi:MAG: hypothetical protein V7K86_13685 [Nostoc sp.]|uniref:hypothetical protein n=1 Tax=Nostoc sp. TaxID=1180 RepID=UPI002FF93F1E
MTDKPLRPQLNIRLDKYPSLLDDIKQAAGDRNTTASQFVLDAILSAVGKPTTTTPTDTASLEAILAEVDELIDAKLDKRLGDFERRLLAQFRQDDGQPAPEELIEDIPETRPEVRPDYQAVRDRVLRSLTTGRGRIAPSAPQYRAASRALDRFISEIEADAKTPPKA